MINFSNYEYLHKHDVINLEDLVGKTVFIPYLKKGIRELYIRRIEFGKKREWFIHADTTHRLSELGNGIFFDKEEAREYQLSKLEEYTKEQQERILTRNYELKRKELKELERLLAKYPDEESRKLEGKSCDNCKYYGADIPHTCDMCTSLDTEDYYMWEAKLPIEC